VAGRPNFADPPGQAVLGSISAPVLHGFFRNEFGFVQRIIHRKVSASRLLPDI
jgi:hypothetical protein